MKDITKQTLEEINKRFNTENGFIVSDENLVYCPQVNGVTNLCLNDLGFREEAQNNSRKFLDSPSFDDRSGLFYREVDLQGKIVNPAFSTCKNAMFSLGLLSIGFTDEATEILDKLKSSSLYQDGRRLYGLDYDSLTNNVNPLLITHSNLSVALANISIGRNNEAREIIGNLEDKRYNQDEGLFDSQDCRNDDYDKKFFVDDQALAILVYERLSETHKAENLAKSVLNSPLYDSKSGLFNRSFSRRGTDTTKSTYKNGLIAQAFGKLGYSEELKGIQEGLIRELYDPNERLFNHSSRDKTKIPDNSALALVALEYRV
tara:strand:- start:4683 stop:5633 length:951 start_codon:yes stop_codon:yes gene_type:complete